MRIDKIYKHIVTSILYCSIDFVMEDIEYSATVTGVDIAGSIGEESDPVFFTLDSEYFQYICIQILLPIFNIDYKQ